MGHADHQIEVAHHFAKDARRHLAQRDRPPVAAPHEEHVVDRQPLDLGRGEEPLLERHRRAEALGMEGAAHALLRPRDPAARSQQGQRLAGLHLLPAVAAGPGLVAVAPLAARRQVQLAEHLLERLDALRGEAVVLPGVPAAIDQQVVRVGQAQVRRVAPSRGQVAVAGAEQQRRVSSSITTATAVRRLRVAEDRHAAGVRADRRGVVTHKDEVAQQARQHGVGQQVRHFHRREAVAPAHGPFQ